MKLQKIASLVLAIIMILSLGVTAFAANEGSITINGASTENVYSIYKLLDLESYDKASGAYSYKVNAAWTGFFGTSDALTYVEIDSDGYVKWKAAEDDATVAAFAKLALAYAKANGISYVKSSANPGEFIITTDPITEITSGKFSDLELGYYLIDSTMGALCGLTTTNPDASINAKNGAPTIDKQVKEDSTGQWGASNTAEIGQVVEYRVTINVHQGAQNYVLHDKMSEGLTFKTDSVSVKLISGTETTVDPANYTVVTPGTDGCTFDVTFSEDFCNTLETNDKLIISYSATINENAVIGGEGDKNSAKLDYGDNHHTTEDIVKTYTYGFDIVKTDSQNTLIDGAEFKIYDAATGGTEVKVVKISDTLYRRAKEGEPGDTIAVKDGKVRVIGFDNGTYYLEETKAPDGYNKLTARTKFIISDSNLDAIFNSGIFSTGSGVHVVNKTGSMLPETGGIGTTLFYVAGGILVAGSVVFLVTKKRMGSK